jgi:hypothetical protein
MIAGPLFLYYLTLLAEGEADPAGDTVETLIRAILGGVAGWIDFFLMGAAK